MGQTPVIQTSFNSGEWAPALNARVDLTKYHSGAALIRNFFIDYRGGATTRPGTRYILQTRFNTPVRLIPFQASFTVSYMLEFGNGYVRFFNNGAAVLEAAKTIISAAAGPPEVFTSAAHGYVNGDWLFIGGNYYIVAGATTNTFTLTDLFGNAVNTNPFTLPTSAQRVYTIVSPFLSTEVFGIKYAQNVNQLILCHPNHPPYILTLNSATNWTLNPIVFGATVTTPTGTSVTSNLGASTANYAYVVTAVDVNGQESAPTAPILLSNVAGFTAGTNALVHWTAVSGAMSYNVYKAAELTGTPIPSGAQYGFVGNCTGNTFNDNAFVPDFSQGPPLIQNPFAGSGVQTVTLLTGGSNYTSIPTVNFTASPGITATATPTMSSGGATLVGTGQNYNVGDILTFPGNVQLVVASINFPLGSISSFFLGNAGAINTGALAGASSPTQPITQTGVGFNATFFINYRVSAIVLGSPGTGYLVAPAVTVIGGGGSPPATASSTLGTASSGNPTVPGFIQQRMVMAAPVLSPSQFNMSQPGAQFNFNVTDPVADDNAIQGTLVSGQLNTIQSMISMPAGLIFLSDKQAWLVNGGSAGSAIGATSIVANAQAYNGSSPLPPIVANYDILYVQAKGSIVRDLTYNFYTNIYTGTDISVLSSHLFYGFNLIQWAWAEEPFKTVWAVRNDGQLLSLTFQKEQEMIAWAHSDTQGLFQSVATITETVSFGAVDAVYHVVQRQIQGQTVQYIERFVELFYPSDYKSSWQVDAGIGYNAAPATTFSGAQHLGGQVVTGVADGVVINFTMPASGTFVFGPGGTVGLTGIANASIVTVGLSFTPQLQTLPLDLGEPTVQGKRKKITGVTVRCANTLGLSIGRDSNPFNLVPMKDLILGNLGTMTNQIVTGLVTADARTIINPLWDVPGQYFIQQSNPYPASILGVIPEIAVGDTAGGK